MNYDFTAQMEDSLDQVASHQAEWKKVLDSFFSDFTDQLEKAEKDPEEGGMLPNQMVLTSIDCPTCGRKMGIRTATTGVFLGCSGYALSPKERCKTTINLVPENEVLNVLEGDDAETNALRAKRRCKKCGTAMDSYLIDPNVSCTSAVITQPVMGMRSKRASSALKAMTARLLSARSVVLKCT
jgi:DNA topoisomerase-1